MMARNRRARQKLATSDLGLTPDLSEPLSVFEATMTSVTLAPDVWSRSAPRQGVTRCGLRLRSLLIDERRCFRLHEKTAWGRKQPTKISAADRQNFAYAIAEEVAPVR